MRDATGHMLSTRDPPTRLTFMRSPSTLSSLTMRLLCMRELCASQSFTDDVAASAAALAAVPLVEAAVAQAVAEAVAEVAAAAVVAALAADPSQVVVRSPELRGSTMSTSLLSAK